MLLTPHVLVGASIGALTDNLALIILLAFVSHFVLDMLPHADWGMWHSYEKNFKLTLKDYILVAIDILGVLIFTYVLWNNADRNNNILIGAFFAILVDLIDNVPFWKNYFRKLPIFSQMHQLHVRIHYQLDKKYWIWGVVTQIIIIAICFVYVNNS
ncbi:MAG: hypothetical protein ACD_58C00327G0002 [uncultured bacterium]|nr:MAG: hypothetical protein ACD_58C00327G0002 [uncultured bacterium]